jgi:hypothetical protein
VAARLPDLDAEVVGGKDRPADMGSWPEVPEIHSGPDSSGNRSESSFNVSLLLRAQPGCNALLAQCVRQIKSGQSVIVD